jgi:CAAX amino terminal protease family.
MSKRAVLFYCFSFAISWALWAPLIFAAPSRPAHHILFGLGGLGPAIAAYAAVLLTPKTAPLSEFHARLFRWRLPLHLYLGALGLPAVLIVASAACTQLLFPHAFTAVFFRPWYAWFEILPVMIISGGLEELGWRGVALQESRASLCISALFIGVLWTLWHLPLFFVAGTEQAHIRFVLFAPQTIGLALLLAWFYRQSGSILPCVLFHASFNAMMAYGFVGDAFAIFLASANLLLGFVLLAFFSPPDRLRELG